MCRHERLKGTPSDVAPILWQYGALARLKKGETIDKLLYDGYSTISLGYAGLCECTRYMTGKSHTDPVATPFALSVMEYLNDACARWKAETNIDFSLYGTPLESTTYKFAKCLQKRFGMIPEVTDKNYITNSYHCQKCGFDGEIQIVSDEDGKLVWECPCCGNRDQDTMNVARRTCGYIGTQFWNQGRTQEIQERVLHL